MNNYMKIDKDPQFASFVEGKRIAYVGPSPHLIDQGLGPLIDSYDIVIKINEAIDSPADYGSRMDAVNNCLNNDYAPLLGSFLQDNERIRNNMKYIMCCESCKPTPEWPRMPDTQGNYDKYIKKFSIPFYIINQDQRSEIGKEIHSKIFIENGVSNVGNFNNGYAGILVLLRHAPKELFLAGINFYNFGLAKGLYISGDKGFKDVDAVTKEENKELKYHSSYIKYYKNKGHRNYERKQNFTALHDQLAQIDHFKNMVVPEHTGVIVMDEHLKTNLYTEELEKRLQWHRELPYK